MDLIEGFLHFAEGVGCAPSANETIIADDKRYYFTIEGHAPNSKKGAYQLKIDDGFAVGWVRNFKEGALHTYVSKSSRKFTTEERTEWKIKAEAAKKAQQEEIARSRATAAVVAQAKWKAAKPVDRHAYLNRKKCQAHGLRQYDGKLVIPVYIGGKITSVQTINGDGDKIFLTDGEIKGGFFPLATSIEEKTVIIMCEGFATGASIREVTKLPVIVAFNAGNLKYAAKVIKDKYPDSEIVFAADNDFNTKRQNGDEWNPGLDAAKQAALAIGGARVICPELVNDKNTDFNDVFIALGADAVAKYFEAPAEPTHAEIVPEWLEEMPPLEAYDDEERKLIALYTGKESQDKSNWREKLNYKEDGKINGKSIVNATLFLENDKILGNLFCYDEFADEKKLYQCPPWEDVKKFRVRRISDDDITSLTCELERRGIQQPFGVVAKLLSAIIKNNSRNPAVEYFNSLKWDGVKRLDNWLINYCHATHDDEQYVQAVGRKWLTAAVTRVYNPGAKFDSMLVLEGSQNAGKSLVLRHLATINGREYFEETIKVSDLGNDKIVPKLQGVLIVELAEMSGMNDKAVEELRQGISTTHDRIVRKYENEASSYPRKFVLAGTYNPTNSGILKDETGNRRFWIVRVGDKIDIDAIVRDKEQLWAEAVVAYKEGEKLYLEGELYEKAAQAQKERMAIHPWHFEIKERVEHSDRISDKEIWEHLKIDDRSKWTIKNRNDISTIMAGLGFERSRRRFAGNLEYCWLRLNADRELALD